MATFTPTTNPMIITSAATVVATRPFLAKRIEWYAPQTIGNYVSITDLNANIIIEGTCEVASQSQILWSGPNKLTLPGKATVTTGSWVVPTIQSGSLIIWWG
jgi:hypothetical protein